MRRPLVAGNWKMNGSKASIATLLDGIKAGLAGSNAAEVAVCPPFVYLELALNRLSGTAVALGAQNVSNEPAGAYTGEVSASMLKDVGCKYVIVGHSERRGYYAESDLLVAKKFAAVRAAGMMPILCVGETLAEREQNITESVVARQLAAVLDLEGVTAVSEAVIAYEPVWAIGTGRTATPQQAQDVHAFIRGQLATLDGTAAQKARILYGGSVKASNAQELFGQPDIDGGLIGGASLNAEEFLAICRAAH